MKYRRIEEYEAVVSPCELILHGGQVAEKGDYLVSQDGEILDIFTPEEFKKAFIAVEQPKIVSPEIEVRLPKYPFNVLGRDELTFKPNDTLQVGSDQCNTLSSCSGTLELSDLLQETSGQENYLKSQEEQSKEDTRQVLDPSLYNPLDSK